MDKLREECGVFGVFSDKTEDLARSCYYGLYALQHRGQESCGIVVNDDGVFHDYKDVGLVNDVFTQDVLKSLGAGNIAVGHVRYGTTGAGGRLNAQPIVVNHVKGRMALAHNGNLTNSYELREELEMNGSIFHTTSDTEVISYIITKERISSPSIEEAVNRAMHRLKGAYSLVIMSPSKLIAARDEHGFRPLCYGRTGNGDYVVASESCALDSVGATFIRDIEPGEMVVIDDDGVKSYKFAEPKLNMCVFEYIYFARPDSVLDGLSVHEARFEMGRVLARETNYKADIVISVPDSGNTAASGYAYESGIPYVEGLVKNRYIGRTFIQPTQKKRDTAVKLKLNAISSAVKGKSVVMIDDSIVRGTTSGKIVRMLRNAGAREIHMCISSPPIVYPCYYGIDTSVRKELIAATKSVEEICEYIGADSLHFLSLDGLKHCMRKLGPDHMCYACFDGGYPIEQKSASPAEHDKYVFEQRKK